MKSDKSRETFVRGKHYKAVRKQLGRMTTDADWNEQADIQQHRDQTTTHDVIGPSGAPVDPDGFGLDVAVSSDGQELELTLQPGRIYVDGILCENEHEVSYTAQPDFPNPPEIPVPMYSGVRIAYLDVWQRHIGALEDPSIREVALGGPDTASRAQTVWQLKILEPDLQHLVEDLEGLDEWIQLITPPDGKMSARAQPEDTSSDPCVIPEQSGYRRLENQLYRVEIHRTGILSDSVASIEAKPTFKWSRDNGSVVAEWLELNTAGANTLRIAQTIRDEVLGFSAGDWVELTDDARELAGNGGIMVQLDAVDGDVLTFRPSTAWDPLLPAPSQPPTIVRANTSLKPKVRRWDSQRDILVQRPSSGDGWIPLEDGVEVRFENGNYRAGDYWLIPARSAIRNVLWPTQTLGGETVPVAQPPRGIQHHYACLAGIEVNSFLGSFLLSIPPRDCRKPFKPLTELPMGVDNDLPLAGQYRYYLINGDAGSDEQGTVGIDDDPQVAFGNAQPFKTISHVTSIFPREGHDSIAVILIQPLPQGASYPEDFVLGGVHGYRYVLIRGSNLTNDDADRLACGSMPASEYPNGIPVAFFDFVTDPRFELEERIGFQGGLIPSSTAVLGTRVRLESVVTELQGVHTMLLRHEDASEIGPFLRVSDSLGTALQTNDVLHLERPGTQLGLFWLRDCDCPIHIVGLSSQGMLMTRMGNVISISFCTTFDFTARNVDTLRFVPSYASDVGSDVKIGSGIEVRGLMTVEGGRNLLFTHSAVKQEGATGRATLQSIDSITMSHSYLGAVHFLDCEFFMVGQSELPRNMILGSPSGERSVVLTERSDGRLQGIYFRDDTPIDQERGHVAAVQVRGHQPNLELDSIVYTLDNTPEPTVLDLSEATSAEVLFNTGPTLQSGVIRLPDNAEFHPRDLEITDTFDSKHNHLQGLGGSVVQEGLAFRQASNASPFSVMRFEQQGSPAEQATVAAQASAGGPDVRATFAGVTQAGILFSTSEDTQSAKRTVHVTSGYSLLRTDFNFATAQPPPLPAPVYLSEISAGAVSFTPPVSGPSVRIGVATQVMPDTRNTSSRFLMVRLHVDLPE